MKYIFFTLFAMCLVFIVYRLKQYYSVWLVIHDKYILEGDYPTFTSRMLGFVKSLGRLMKSISTIKILFDGTFFRTFEELGAGGTVTMVDKISKRVDQYVDDVVNPIVNELIYHLKTLTGSYTQAYLLIHLFLNAAEYHPSQNAKFFEEYREILSKVKPPYTTWLDQLNSAARENDPNYSVYMQAIFIALQKTLDQRQEDIHPSLDFSIGLVIGRLLNEEKHKAYFGPSFLGIEEIRNL